MRRWKLGTATAVAAATAAAIGLVPMIGPASAHREGAYSTSFVDGAGKLTNDSGDHYSEIGNSPYKGCANSWNTDTVLMWQAILVAEGFLSHSGLDGKFGSNTATATKKWQSRYGLTADGKVGSKTWAKADDRLRWAGNGEPYYDGWIASGKVHFTRGNQWSAYDGGSYWLRYVRDDDGSNSTWFDTVYVHHIDH